MNKEILSADEQRNFRLQLNLSSVSKSPKDGKETDEKA